MLIQNRARKAGSALVVALVTGMVIGIVLVSYLTMVSSNQRAVVRSENWHATMPLIEAGIEEAMAHLHRNYHTNAMSNGWWGSDTNVLKLRWFGEGAYVVNVMGTNQPVIESYGFMRSPMNNFYNISRRVRAQTVHTSVVTKVVFADETIKLNGFSMNTDSYDSRDTNYSTATGQYDPTRNKDGGDVGTNSDEQGAFDSGNSQIYGTVSTGAGATVDVGSLGSIGSDAWHDSGSTGIEPGWSNDDARFDARASGIMPRVASDGAE